MANAVVEINGLSKIFQRDSFAVTALEDVDLLVSEGEFLCLMGPSGSGKTTLLNIIAGIDRPTKGHLSVLGEDVAGMSEDQLAAWRNAHVGFIFQTFNLILVLTAFIGTVGGRERVTNSSSWPEDTMRRQPPP